jgi:hypothetical protein
MGLPQDSWHTAQVLYERERERKREEEGAWHTAQVLDVV